MAEVSGGETARSNGRLGALATDTDARIHCVGVGDTRRQQVATQAACSSEGPDPPS